MTEGRGNLPPTDPEIWSLVEAIVDGTITPGERDRLEARLRSEPQARLFYVAYLDLHAHLQWRTRGESVQTPAKVQASPGGKERKSERNPGYPHWSQTGWGTLRWFGSLSRPALAACLLLAAGLVIGLLVPPHASDEGESPDFPDAPAGSVAVLIDDKNTVWEKDMALPTESGSALLPGRLKLKAGVVQLAFLAGGEVLLEGPADFDVSAADRGFLHRGKLTAKVAEGAPAFRVGMPGVVVTDLSGECGLLREESGLTEVHVFEGRVDADPTDQREEPSREIRLIENAGARVDTSRRTITPLPLNEKAFAHLRREIRITEATVRGGRSAGRNFAMASQLMVKNSISDFCWETYLRFDLSSIQGKVSQARVRLVPVRVGQPVENAAALVADNLWGETTITWDKKPSSGPAITQWTARQGEPVEFDVTRFVQEALGGDKKLSLRIFSPKYGRGKSYVQYGSRKGDAEMRPQLLVTAEP